MPDSVPRRRKSFGEVPDAAVEATPDIARQYSDACALLEVARSLLGTRRSDEILGRLLHSILGVAGAAHCVGFLHKPADHRLQIVVSFGHTTPARSHRLAVSDELAEFLCAAGHAGTIPVRHNPSLAGSPLSGPRAERWLEDLGAELLLPIVVRTSLAGVGVVGPRLGGEPYCPEERALLGRAAAFAGHAIEAGLNPAELAGEREYATSPDLGRITSSQVARRLRALRQKHPTLQQILGESPALLLLLEQAVSVSPTRCPVLIEGETGSGKEALARALHEMSPRSAEPFEVVDCGSIPKELIESELFGHERGAFTGAVRDRRGLFEMAHRGTIFLDELGELPLSCQTRLLRVLQEGCFRRVGGEATVRVDVRVVAATNRNLWDMVEAGRFRRDLFYRVSVLALRVPPLRERKEDIPVLARHFASLASREMGTPPFQIDRTLEHRLEQHEYPGNIRELQNLVTALAVGSRGRLDAQDVDLQLGRLLQVTRLNRRHDESAAPRRGEPSMGSWVLEHLRRHAFNIAAAERALETTQARRGTLEAPVADRSTLTYYLQGECLREFCTSGFDLERAVRSVAGEAHFIHPVEKRFRVLLRALSDVASSHESPDAARREMGHRLAKLPACYREYVSRALQSYQERRWSIS